MPSTWRDSDNDNDNDNDNHNDNDSDSTNNMSNHGHCLKLNFIKVCLLTEVCLTRLCILSLSGALDESGDGTCKIWSQQIQHFCEKMTFWTPGLTFFKQHVLWDNFMGNKNHGDEYWSINKLYGFPPEPQVWLLRSRIGVQNRVSLQRCFNPLKFLYVWQLRHEARGKLRHSPVADSVNLGECWVW